MTSIIMQVGTYEVPEVRLYPKAIEDIKEIAKATRGDDIHSEDLAKLLRYSSSHSGGYYRRLNSLLSYGLLSGRGKFKVTQLGEDIAAFSGTENNYLRQLYKQAVLNVRLWNELYKKHKKSLPESIWLDIKSITGVSSAEAQAVQNEIRTWYKEDVALIPDEEEEEKLPEVQKPYSSSGTSNKPTMGIQQQPVLELAEGVIGRIIVRDGFIDVKNKTSYEIAKSYLNLMKEELNIKDESDSNKKDSKSDVRNDYESEEHEKRSRELETNLNTDETEMSRAVTASE